MQQENNCLSESSCRHSVEYTKQSIARVNNSAANRSNTARKQLAMKARVMVNVIVSFYGIRGQGVTARRSIGCA
jgi:hypothetical protein